MEMTKFEDEHDAGFVAVTAELRRWIKQGAIPHVQSQIDQVALRT